MRWHQRRGRGCCGCDGGTGQGANVIGQAGSVRRGPSVSGLMGSANCEREEEVFILWRGKSALDLGVCQSWAGDADLLMWRRGIGWGGVVGRCAAWVH